MCICSREARGQKDRFFFVFCLGIAAKELDRLFFPPSYHFYPLLCTPTLLQGGVLMVTANFFPFKLAPDAQNPPKPSPGGIIAEQQHEDKSLFNPPL